MIFRTTILLSLFALVAVGHCLAQSTSDGKSAVKASKVFRVRGNVLAVEDSDRVKLASDDGNVYSLILAAVDAPDEKQALHKKAKKRLADLVEGKEVTAMLRTNERNETFAILFVGPLDAGLTLIQDGLAWYNAARGRDQSAADREKYLQAEAAARSAKRGLWDDKDPVAPWTFRGETIDSKQTSVADTVTETPAKKPTENKHPDRKYILGPRGGCYYLNDQGHKVYVKDKSLCGQQ